MAKCVIFMEGSSNTDNGDLRIGFGKLLRKADLPQQPRIIMGNDTAGAIRLFQLELDKPKSAFDHVLLLVDLDGPSATRASWLAAKKLTPHADRIFFMVQQMEAWFLAQPELLQQFYPGKLAHALPKAAPEQVPHPDQVLTRCTHNHPKKGSYHKTRHGASLLADSHLPTLQAAFPDVAGLLATI